MKDENTIFVKIILVFLSIMWTLILTKKNIITNIIESQSKHIDFKF